MATVTTGYAWNSGDEVTAGLLNQMVNSAQVTAIAANDLSSNSVTTVKIADDAVTAAKLDGVASINQQTAGYTLVLSDAGRVIEVNSGSNVTVTVPTNAAVAFAVGATVVVTRKGAGEVTIAGSGGVTLRSADSRLKIGKQYAAAAIVKIATDEWMVLGNLKA